MYSATHKTFRADAVSCTQLLSLTLLCRKSTLQMVVKERATEEGHQHSEIIMGCTVYGTVYKVEQVGRILNIEVVVIGELEIFKIIFKIFSAF